MDFSNLGGLFDQMKDAYEDGINAMNGMSDRVAQDMDPTHQIEVDIKLEGNAEGHPYKVDAELLFSIDLDTLVQAAESPMGDLSAVLGQLGVDLGGDADAVMEQISQPRSVGVLKNVTENELVVHAESGRVDASLNEKATLLATLEDGQLRMNFEGVFTYPENPGLFIIVPSGEQMQENICFGMDALNAPLNFEWVDQDGLKVSGSARISSLT